MEELGKGKINGHILRKLVISSALEETWWGAEMKEQGRGCGAGL